QCAPGGDIAAHDTRPDDVHAPEHRLLLAADTELLEAFAEEEHPPEVSRGRGRHQWHEAFGFAPRHLTPVVALLLEQVDERMRRRIMFGAGLLAGLGAHLLDDLRPDEAVGEDRLGPWRRLRLAIAEHRLARLPAQHVAVPNQLVDEAEAA